MNRRWSGALIAVAALVVLAAVAWLWRTRSGAPAGDFVSANGGADAAGVGAAPPSPDAPALERRTAELFFPAASDRLLSETREVASDGEPKALAAAILSELLSAKPAAPRVPVFPGAVEIGKVIPLADGTMVVDLRSEAADPPASGSTVELLRVYSLVHSVLRNIPEVNQVVLLWNGNQRRSFAGHVDTSRPLRVRSELEAARATGDAARALPATPSPAPQPTPP